MWDKTTQIKKTLDSKEKSITDKSSYIKENGFKI